MNTKKWRVNLPLFSPEPVMDNSTISEYTNCPRKGFYRYGLRRGFPSTNFPIQYGSAYHKYREVVEDLMQERGCTMNDEVHVLAMGEAVKDWEDPPIEHKKAYLNLSRLTQAIELARKRIEQEQKTGMVKVTRSEDSFDLELPFYVCERCGHATLDEITTDEWECEVCHGRNEAIFSRARHGGRVDQFILYNNGHYIRDFKTTGRKGKTYEQKFDPNNQIQGYVWSGEKLSGRTFNGAMIETVYNTKTQGPTITQHYVNFSKGQQEQWIASMMMERQMIQTMWSRVEELGYLAFPQRTNHCMQYGPCGFLDACRSGSGFEIEEWLKNYTIESHWDFTDPDAEESDEA